MKLLVIYGPPAVGKLTVANEISSRSDFKVFHNHKSIDVYTDVLDYGAEGFWEKVNELRFEIIELAASRGMNLIFTFCYGPNDEPFIQRLEQIIDKYNGELYFAQLLSSKKELLNRVAQESRAKHGKVQDPDHLSRILDWADYSLTIPHKNSLLINNTDKSTEKVAMEIIDNFHFDN